MNRIILHWTAGGYIPTSYEKECYHFLIDTLGKIHKGKFKPEDNTNCTDKIYAAHTGGGNTNSIGIALCGMAGYKNKNNIGNFPINKVQFESAMKFCAEMCKKYNIKVSPETVMTHYEFGIKNPKTSSAGKIDLTFIPPYDWVATSETGSFIRSKIKWYLLKMENL